jgi:hypothetical protein
MAQPRPATVVESWSSPGVVHRKDHSISHSIPQKTPHTKRFKLVPPSSWSSSQQRCLSDGMPHQPAHRGATSGAEQFSERVTFGGQSDTFVIIGRDTYVRCVCMCAHIEPRHAHCRLSPSPLTARGARACTGVHTPSLDFPLQVPVALYNQFRPVYVGDQLEGTRVSNQGGRARGTSKWRAVTVSAVQRTAVPEQPPHEAWLERSQGIITRIRRERDTTTSAAAGGEATIGGQGAAMGAAAVSTAVCLEHLAPSVGGAHAGAEERALVDAESLLDLALSEWRAVER